MEGFLLMVINFVFCLYNFGNGEMIIDWKVVYIINIFFWCFKIKEVFVLYIFFNCLLILLFFFYGGDLFF